MDFSQLKKWTIPEGEVSKLTINNVVVWLAQKLEHFASTLFPFTLLNSAGEDLKQYQIYGQSIQRNLPEGYTQLEWIESTTTQYINTGIKGELESELTFIGQRTGDNQNQVYGHLWGDLAVSARSISFNTPKTASNSGSSRFGDKATSSSTSPVKVIPLNTPVTIIQNKEKATASTGFEITFGTTTEFETDNPLFLFTAALSGGGPTASSHKWRCEYFSHKKGGVLVQEFIPCKNAQGEIGMYDTVSGNFFASNSSTPFVAGSEVQPTPTPTNPIEVVSVGDRTKNLFNKDGEITNWYSSGRLITSASANRTFAVRHVAGTKYYYKHCNVAGGGRYFYTTVENPELNSEASVMNGTTIIQPNQVVTVDSIPDEAKWVFFNAGRTGQTATAQEQLADFMVTTTPIDENTPYEPYGYKVPVVIGGKNLANTLLLVEGDLSGSKGTVVIARDKYVSDFIQIKHNTDYYCQNVTTYCLYDENKIYVTGANTIGNPNFSFNSNTSSYIRIAFNRSDINTVQLEQGSQATPYEPYVQPTTTNIYLDEPLRKIGEYEDYIDFENQKVVRNINKIRLLDLNFGKHSSYANIYRSGTINNVPNINPIAVSYDSKKYTPAKSIGSMTDNYCIKAHATSTGLYISDNIHNTKEEFDNFLETIDDTVYYTLATPTEQPITLPAISLPSGTVTIDVDTNIKPSKMEGDYKK